MYSNEMTFSDWTREAGARGNAVIGAISAGKTLYDKWYQLTYGKTNAQIAAMPQFAGKGEADISAIAYALGALNELSLALHNGTVAAADRAGYLTPIL